jgi:hypothetical protein
VELDKNKLPKLFQFRPIHPNSRTNGGVFGRGRILLGRNETCDLMVNNESISAVHAVLEIFDDHAVIYDMNSTNGTFVNNNKVIVKEIFVGDTFRLADVEFKFLHYSQEDSIPPVLNTLEPLSGEASVKYPPMDSDSSLTPKSLPKSAPSVTVAVPSIVYPLAADPKAEFSEYIFEDKQDLYPIFKYESSRQAVEVIILFKDQVFSIDYLPEGKGIFHISGILTRDQELEFPYLGKSEKIPFVEVHPDHAVVHTLPGFGVFLLSDKKTDSGHVSTDVELRGQDILRLYKSDLQIYVRNVNAPPSVAHAPFLKRDPEFRKYLALFFILVGMFSFSINLIEIPKDERKNELAPERLATILYKERLTISENPLVSKTENKPNIAQKAPELKNVEKKETVDKKLDVKKVNIVETKNNDNKPDPGKKNVQEKKIVKQGTQPITKPSDKLMSTPLASNNKSKNPKSEAPAAKSNVEAKSLGHVEVYKSADFKSSISSLVAKGGSLSGVETKSFSGADGSLIGSSSGVKTGTGTIKTADISTNQGSLVGATTGVLGESKGAEGLSAKRAVYTAGIPSETVVLGSMDPDVIRRRLMEFLPQFRSCYQRELETKGSEINGTIRLNFVIGSSGHVAKAGLDGSTPLPRDVSSCVINVLRGITFPEPLGGGTVEVKQPMNFQPKRI